MEGAGPGESSFLVRDLPDGVEEVSRRQALYVGLEDKYSKLGAPSVGRSGALLWQWVMRAVNLQRSEVFIANTLACCCGKTPGGGAFYPIGNVRKRAEATCGELWLQPLLVWDPTVSVVGMHPNSLAVDITPLPVLIRAVEKCKMFAARGERVLLLLGGKAAHHWMGYASNTTRWCGHFQFESEYTKRKRSERWAANRRLSVEKKVKAVKVKKLTVKMALADLLQSVIPSPCVLDRYVSDVHFTKERWDEMLALYAPKVKKMKGEVG